MRLLENGQELNLTQIFDAPRDLVWQAWTDAVHLAQWWGPDGFTNPLCKLDVKPTGEIRIDMRGPDGVVYPMSGSFQLIKPPILLCFTSIALDQNLNPIFENLNTITFIEHEGKTKLTLQVKVLQVTDQADAYLQGMNAGWTQSLERLKQKVEKKKCA